MPEDLRARVLLSSNLGYTGEDADESMRHLQSAVALRPGYSTILYDAACTSAFSGEKHKRSKCSRKP